MVNRNGVLAVFSGCMALGVFLLTLAPDLTWANFGGDGGELITAAVTWGVPHPSGYPLYVLLGRVFGWFPAGTIAWRLHLFSATCVAVSAGFVAAIYTVVLPNDSQRGYVAVAGGLTLAFTPLVWSQAVIAEVYGLNLAVLAALLWVGVKFGGKRPLSWRRAGLIGGLAGLSVTTHLTSLLLFPLVLSFVPRRRWLALGAGVGVGLLPFGLIFLLARSGSPVRWGDPTTLAGWWWGVSGVIYRGNVWGFPAGDYPARFALWANTFWQNYTWLIFVPLLWLERRKWFPAGQKPLLWTTTILLYVLYAFLYDADDAIIFLLPAFLLLSVRLAPALQKMRQAAILLPLLLLMLNFTLQKLSNQDSVRPVIEPYLQEAPPRAILLAPGDDTIFALWYFHHVEGQRPDVILVDSNLFAFDWYRDYLNEQYSSLKQTEEDDLFGFEEANRATRPVCTLTTQLNCTETPP